METNRKTNIRWLGGSLVLFLCFVAYLDRSVFSVTATPIMKALHISTVQFGVMTTVFSVGYFIFQIPGAILVEKYGSRPMLTISLILWSIFTILTGLARSMMSLAVVRFFFGVGEAPLFPAGNHFYANWFPKEERGRSNSLMNAGSFMANIVGPPIIVAVVSALGWQAPYYMIGVIGILSAFAWYGLMRSTPEQHPWVGQGELKLITEHSFNAEGQEAKKSQWLNFMKQRSFWMIALGYFATLWVVQFFLYWLPYYLQAARHMSFKSMGFYTSVPWIAIVIAVLLAGSISDGLVKRGFSRYRSRNVICVVGLAVSGIALVLSTLASSALGNILWLSLALGMAGVAQTLSWSISTDMGQQYTSTVGGWMNMWGFIAASIVPTIAPIIAQNASWNTVLLINAAITILGIIGFLFTVTDRPLKFEE